VNDFEPIEEEPRLQQRRALLLLSHIVRTQHDAGNVEAAKPGVGVKHSFVVLSPKR
jgi:hypothetical protein